MVQHQRHILVLEVLAQCLERGVVPLALGRQCLFHHIQVQPAGQVAQALGQADHAEVVSLGQARLATGAELQQLALEAGQVGLDLRLLARAQAAQVVGQHIGHAPEVAGVEPRVGGKGIAALHGDPRQRAVHRAGGVDFDDADIAAPRHWIQRVVAPDRTQGDHRIGLARRFLQARATPATEVGRLARRRNVRWCSALQFDRSAVEQGAGQSVGDRQRGEHGDARRLLGRRRGVLRQAQGG
ncbi:hypothetical protein D3C76_1198940 [compost metagenome]